MAFLSGQSCTQILVHRRGNKTRISAPFRRRALAGLFEGWLVLAWVSWKIFSIIFWASNHQIVDKEDYTEFASLRSKRFRLVSEQRNTEEGDFRFWPRENETRAKKWKRGRFPSFLPHPLPALLLEPLFSRSLTLVPRSFLLNRTETLATQAMNLLCKLSYLYSNFTLTLGYINPALRKTDHKFSSVYGYQ